VGCLDFLERAHKLFFEVLGTDRRPGPLSGCTSTFLRETIPETIKLLLRTGSTDANFVEAIVVQTATIGAKRQ
jgi:hypothetical protein